MAKREIKTVKTEVPEVVEQVVEEVEVTETPVPVIGTVAKCSKLNIRKKSNLKADVVCVVNAKAKLTIDESKSNDKWLAVTTEDGKTGYCMKEFVTIGK